MNVSIALLLIISTVLVTEASIPAHKRRKAQLPVIVGGEDTEKGEFPYIVSLQHGTRNLHFCGGSIYDANHVLTAAHCVEGEKVDKTTAVAGEYNLKNEDGTEQTREVCEIYIHEDYNKNDNEDNDIALLKLCEPLDLNKYVSKIVIPSKKTPVDRTCTVIGWGARRDSQIRPDYPDVLQKTSLRVVSDEDCRQACSQFDCVINKEMVCAGYKDGGKDACQGDSGGPLVCTDYDGVYQLGIVSAGYGCGVMDVYGIYTEVYYYRSWIAQAMSKMSK